MEANIFRTLFMILVTSDLLASARGTGTPAYGTVPRYGSPLLCNREPVGVTKERTVGNSVFKIKISGNPEKYVPGEVYTVILSGTSQYHTVHKFSGFMLAVEPRDIPDGAATGATGAPPLPDVGMFQLFGDSLSKISEDCPNGIVHTSGIPKSEIQVMWQAPSAGSSCVVFKATVVESKEVWYKDEGTLTKVLCEEESESLDEQPEILEECCACDEAKYEMVFEGLWSKYTHPKEFPANFWLTHFSDIIGASHSADFRMWEYGGYASEGLRQVAELGVTKKLEAELKAESNKIRTIIKARGLWHPNLNGKTFAVFRVDKKHHLMSMVSMLGPSPDWIVGVSALELCLKNCSWMSEKIMNLYLYDSGTDTGITYLSPNMPTIPQERIKPITSTNPNNPDSPFYDGSGQRMKPFAKLTVARQRVYDKPCDAETFHDNVMATDEPTNKDERDECHVTEWTEFKPCTATCGQGIRMRTRNFIHESKARVIGCTTQLIDKEMCEANCVGDVSCATTTWSDWTECNASCGKGYRTRVRKFMNRSARKVCNHVELVEKELCPDLVAECNEKDAEDPQCSVSQWSEWSPCTVTCGKGILIRTRLYINPNIHPTTTRACNAELIQKAPCVADKVDCNMDVTEAKEICMMVKDVGPCRGYFPRWYYDVNKGMCLQFIYGGCRGNKNNFERNQDCIRMCEVMLRGGQHHHPEAHHSDEQPSGHDYNSNGDMVIDCVLTQWSPWTPCSRSCGTGRRERHREIKLNPLNGGKPCDKKLTQRRRCKDTPPCPVDCRLSAWSDWSPCTVTCGEGGIKYRQRTIVKKPDNGGAECGHKIERLLCDSMTPCQVD